MYKDRKDGVSVKLGLIVYV